MSSIDSHPVGIETLGTVEPKLFKLDSNENMISGRLHVLKKKRREDTLEGVKTIVLHQRLPHVPSTKTHPTKRKNDVVCFATGVLTYGFSFPDPSYANFSFFSLPSRATQRQRNFVCERTKLSQCIIENRKDKETSPENLMVKTGFYAATHTTPELKDNNGFMP